jgi:hypothetical protein
MISNYCHVSCCAERVLLLIFQTRRASRDFEKRIYKALYKQVEEQEMLEDEMIDELGEYIEHLEEKFDVEEFEVEEFYKQVEEHEMPAQMETGQEDLQFGHINLVDSPDLEARDSVEWKEGTLNLSSEIELPDFLRQYDDCIDVSLDDDRYDSDWSRGVSEDLESGFEDEDYEEVDKSEVEESNAAEESEDVLDNLDMEKVVKNRRRRRRRRRRRNQRLKSRAKEGDLSVLDNLDMDLDMEKVVKNQRRRRRRRRRNQRNQRLKSRAKDGDLSD